MSEIQNLDTEKEKRVNSRQQFFLAVTFLLFFATITFLSGLGYLKVDQRLEGILEGCMLGIFNHYFINTIRMSLK